MLRPNKIDLIFHFFYYVTRVAISVRTGARRIDNIPLWCAGKCKVRGWKILVLVLFFLKWINHLPWSCHEVWRSLASDARSRCTKLPFAVASRRLALASAFSAPLPVVEPSYFVSVTENKWIFLNEIVRWARLIALIKKSHYIQVLVCITVQFPVGRVEIKTQSFFVSPVIFLRFTRNDIKVNSFKPLGVWTCILG